MKYEKIITLTIDDQTMTRAEAWKYLTEAEHAIIDRFDDDNDDYFNIKNTITIVPSPDMIMSGQDPHQMKQPEIGYVEVFGQIRVHYNNTADSMFHRNKHTGMWLTRDRAWAKMMIEGMIRDMKDEKEETYTTLSFDVPHDHPRF